VTIKVKFLAKTPPDQDMALWLSLFPKRMPKIGDVSFHFDLGYRDYDWLVIYEGLPPLPGEKKINRRDGQKPSACSPSQSDISDPAAALVLWTSYVGRRYALCRY